MRILRGNKGWSLGDLRRATGISMPYLNRIERDEAFPRRDKMVAIISSLDPEGRIGPALLAERDKNELERLGWAGDEAELLARLVNVRDAADKEALLARLGREVDEAWETQERDNAEPLMESERLSQR